MIFTNQTCVLGGVFVLAFGFVSVSVSPVSADGAYDSGGHGVNVHACRGGRYQQDAGGAWADLPGGWTCYNGVMAPTKSLSKKAKAGKAAVKGAVKPAAGKSVQCCADGMDRIMETVD